MRTILKTIFTQKSEIVYLVAQFLELGSLVDRILLLEPSFTHTGRARDLIGPSDIYRLLQNHPELLGKIDYTPIYSSEGIINHASTERDCHRNEKVTRGAFVRRFKIHPTDIVISTDADEVLYRDRVEIELRRLRNGSLSKNAVHLSLHQFFYNDTLKAKEFLFNGPSIILGKHYVFSSLGLRHWRYAGLRSDAPSGCHFSWCLPIDDLVQKASSFAHAPDYVDGQKSVKERIQDDIENRRYSFRKESLRLTKISNPEEVWPTGYIRAISLLKQCK